MSDNSVISNIYRISRNNDIPRATSKLVHCGFRHDRLLVTGFSSIASSMYHTLYDYHYYTLTKQMFSRVYWNQPVRPCVSLCTKYQFLSKRWLGYKTIKSDLVTVLVIIINSRSSSIWLFFITQKVRYAIIIISSSRIK